MIRDQRLMRGVLSHGTARPGEEPGAPGGRWAGCPHAGLRTPDGTVDLGQEVVQDGGIR